MIYIIKTNINTSSCKIKGEWNWKLTLYSGYMLYIKFPNGKEHGFDVSKTSVYKIKKWYEASKKEQSKLKVFFQVKGKKYNKFKKYTEKNREPYNTINLVISIKWLWWWL